MKRTVLLFSTILTCVFAFSAISYALAPARTPNIQIHIYLDPDTENAALQAGTVDINDWPLTKSWVDTWALMPDSIRLCDYAEMAMIEIDINNQLWPTGDSNNKFYTDYTGSDPTKNESRAAAELRKAIACLLDRDRIVTEVLKGYGFRIDVPVVPSQSAYVDIVNYTMSGIIYNYDRTRAETLLDNAGFTVNPTTQVRRDPCHPGSDLSPLIFYIRQDDPNLRQVGEMLAEELKAEKIPANVFVTERIICYKNVMVLYNFGLYTGGWSLGTIPDQYYDLYSSYRYYGPSIGWSENYPGFCNSEFDSWALKVKYPDTIADAQSAARTCGYLFLKYCPIIPVYCPRVAKAYRTGWTGVVNDVGYGVDNYWTLFLMQQSPVVDNRIDWGFKSDIVKLNVVCSEWLWDRKILDLVYEGLIRLNPFNLAPSEFSLATAAYAGIWDASGVGGSNPATFVNFTLRSGVLWHNVSGSPRRTFTAYDVNFSFYYQYQFAGAPVWSYPSLQDFVKCEVYSSTQIAVFYEKKNAWLLQLTGEVPIINPDTWSFVPSYSEAKNYDPTNQDKNGNGINDIYEDGTGAWMFVSYNPGNSVTLSADTQYYLTSAYVQTRLAQTFWATTGDVNRDGAVNILDLSYMTRSMGRTIADPIGQGWNQYNPDCDFNQDGTVNLFDLTVVAMNFGRRMDSGGR